MKDNKKTELRVGITVVFALIIFIWVLGWAKNFSFGSDGILLSIKFQNIAGLAPGDVVMINGVKSGLVDEVISVENSVVAKVVLDDNVDIRSDATFAIMMLDLMGGKKIEISPGTAKEQIDYNKIYTGSFSGDISSAMAMLTYVQNDLVTGIRELRITLNNINGVIGDEGFNEGLVQSINNLNQLTANLNSIIKKNEDNITGLINNSNQLVSSTNKLLTENKTNIDSAFTNVNQLAAETNNLVIQIQELLRETKNRDNNLGDLLYDKEFAINLKASVDKLHKITDVLIEQLNNEGIKVDANIF